MITAPKLETVTGQAVVLTGVNVDARLTDLMSEVSITQNYVNQEDTNIEAVYTFPLPTDAVLLAMEVMLGTRRLQGVVVEKHQAEERYEDAVTEGDTAIMLQQTEPGMYTMNVGNIMPGESIAVTMRYGQLHKWHEDHLRFALPTVIAPRYGQSTLQPHAEPEVSMSVHHGYDLRLSIQGMLRDARMECPTHAIELNQNSDETVVTLAEQAALDRDFILNIYSQHNQPASALTVRDGEGFVTMAAFHPVFSHEKSHEQDNHPRCLKIVVDCSGSMGGDSMAQARQALQHIVQNLRPQDFFNIVRFGSRFELVFPEVLQANDTNKQKALRRIETMNADLGGTEIGAAMQAAYDLTTPQDIKPDLLLITDGEVWQWEEVAQAARVSKHRIFSVGVGSAVAEAFLREVATTTGGATELVTPNEDMAGRIVRHVKRIYLPRALHPVIGWPIAPQETTPEELSTVYDGDTVFIFARTADRPEGEVTFSVRLSTGEEIKQSAVIQERDLDVLPRLAAYRKLFHADAEKRLQIAMQYQLICDQTNYLVIDETEDKADTLPELRKVEQMPAAGWGGMGSVRAKLAAPQCAPLPLLCRGGDVSESLAKPVPIIPENWQDTTVSDQFSPPKFSPPTNSWDVFVEALNEKCSSKPRLTSLSDLQSLGLPQRTATALQEIIDQGNEEQTVTSVFLAIILQRFADRLSRNAQRWLKKIAPAEIPKDLEQRIMLAVDAV